ncbi:Cysteine-rich secretory protein family protein [Ectothiorhodospira magna]|uniref:Cysteine-rich secretory protein family protein n=1 Tax=Ectothiorhodospira magna TaxID=867345 RepID=A0A1H9BK32_9GAMM|nr:choice-of-anchor L domain-containing protein [Ectothiorhodospira magna]SEP89316.1 Cysteine-rich secretory protein family protein [Ectothiorhodospira magna]
MIQPTSYEQFMLELINRARENPLGEAQLHSIDLNQGLSPGQISSGAKQPLVMNPLLIEASRYHSDWMLQTNTFSHTGASGSSPGDRMAQFGYEFIPPWMWGENVAWQGTTGALPTDLTGYILDHHEGLFLSPGHRENILKEDFKEIGIGHSLGNFTQGASTYSASMVTQKYALSGPNVFLSGVVFQDLDSNQFYTPGEGLENVTISLPELGLETQTWASGGYQLVVPQGSHQVIVSGEKLPAAFTKTVTVEDSNVKLDFMADELFLPVDYSWDDFDWDDFDDWDDDDLGWNDPYLPQTSDHFTLYDSNAQTPKDLLDQISSNLNGIEIVAGSVNYIGADRAVSFFDNINFGPDVFMDKPGILLSSGIAAPPLTNTETGYSVNNNMPGDSDFDALATAAFPGAGKTYDAAILEFSFKVTNPGVQSISFDIIFGSDEYPEFMDSSFVDIAAVLVNGKNYALFDGDPTKPLSIIGANVEGGSFLNNDIQSGMGQKSPYSIEYDGISPRLSINIPLDDDQEVYDVRIGVADTGDNILDSGLFVSNFSTNLFRLDGLQVQRQAPPEGGFVGPAGPDTATQFYSGGGDTIFEGSTAPDIYDLQAGGSNTIQGTAKQLHADSIIGFDTNDTLKVFDSTFTKDDLTVILDVAILEFDSTGDNKKDTLIILQGDFQDATFHVEAFDQGTQLTFDVDQPPDTPEYAGAFMGALAGDDVVLNAVLTNVFSGILGRMLDVDANNEIQATPVFNTLVKVFTFIATPVDQRPANPFAYTDAEVNAIHEQLKASKAGGTDSINAAFLSSSANFMDALYDVLNLAADTDPDAMPSLFADGLDWMNLEDQAIDVAPLVFTESTLV